MDEDEVRILFNGNEENVQYFIQLRDVLSELSSDDQIHYCDPRDHLFSERIKKSQWQYKAVLKTTDDILYQDGNLPGYQSKQTAIDCDVNLGSEKTSADSSGVVASDGMQLEDTSDHDVFECGHQGCTKTFSSLSSYESHYHSCHHYTCATCRRVFVSSFMLDVHIQENHDSYFQILSSRIDMYRCLVESCELKFRTADLRQSHLISEHKFPKSFAFHKPVTESRSRVTKKEDMDTSDRTDDQSEIGNVTGVSSPKPKLETKPRMVPATICFGRGSQRSFQRKPRQKKRIQVDAQMDQR